MSDAVIARHRRIAARRRVAAAIVGGGRPPAPRRIATAIATAPIMVYQRLVSPALPRRCKYEPTCSSYALQAVREYGILRGLVLATWRVLRCNPWSHGGYDPVSAQQVFGARRGKRA